MRSIRAKVALAVGVVILAALFAFASRFYQVTVDWTRQNGLEVASDKTVRLGRWVPADRAAVEDDLRIAFQEETLGYHGAVLGPDGRFDRRQASRYFPEGDFSVPRIYRENAEPWREPHAQWVTAANGQSFAVAWYPLGHGTRIQHPPVGWTVAAVSAGDLEKRTAALKANLGVRMLSIALIMVVVTYLLVGLWTRSLTLAAEAAEQLSRGELGLGELALPTGDDELRRLVRAFNSLLERMRRLHGAQQRFVADAAHELRTPLTILRGEIQVALRKERDLARYQSVLRSNLDEVLRLSRLTDNLLALARADAGEDLSGNEAFSVAKVAQRVLAKLAEPAVRAGVELRLEAAGACDAVGDAVAVDRIALNLVENALKHSEAGDVVIVRLRESRDTVVLEIEDEGTGIAAEHLPRLFERFFRVDSARNRAAGGAGLGLAMVKSLVTRMGGTVTVRSELGHGSVFTVTLPRAGAPRAASERQGHS